MKLCHICEKIVRIQKSIACILCNKVYCKICTFTYFPDKYPNLFAKRDSQSTHNIKIAECFSCLKECKCSKCKDMDDLLFGGSNINQINLQEATKRLSLLSQEEPIPESGFFQGRKIDQLPQYLQRIYMKKKVLYSKHEISSLNNDKNIPEQAINDQLEGKDRMEIDVQRKEAEESIHPNLEQQSQVMKGQDLPQSRNQEKNNPDQDQIADDYQSQYPSRRRQHLHQPNENSNMNDADVEDDNEGDENEPNNEMQQEQSPQRDEDNVMVAQVSGYSRNLNDIDDQKDNSKKGAQINQPSAE